MKALLKVTGWLLGLVVVVAIAAILILPRVFDPNDHKDRIEALVLDKTDRVLTIDGDLSLSVFPSVAVKTGRLTLANPDGGSFGQEKMIEVEAASIDVRLMPLLSKQVEAGEIVLTKPVVRLITLADGTTNWQDLQGDPQAQPSENEQSPNSAVAALAIQGVRIEDGQVLWDDRSTDTRYDVTALSLTTGAISLSQDIPFELSANLQGQALPEPLDLQLSSSAKLDLDAGKVSLSDLDFRALGQTINAGVTAPQLGFDMAASAIDAGLVNVTARVGENDISASLPSLLVDLSAQKITSAGLEAALSAATATASVNAADLAVDLGAGNVALSTINGQATAGENSAKMSLPNFSTTFDQRQFVFDDVGIDAQIGDMPARVEIPSLSVDAENMNAQALGVNLLAEGVTALMDLRVNNMTEALAFDGRLRMPQSDLRELAAQAGGYTATDPEALSAVSLDIEFSGTPEQIDIPTLVGSLDQTALEGSANIGLADNAYGVKLRAGELDLDRYLPQAAAADAAPSEQPAAADSVGTAAGAPVALGSLRIAADVAVERLKLESAGIVVDRLMVNTAADGTGLVPMTVTGLVSGDAVPEAIDLNIVASLDADSEPLTLKNVALKANGETLNGELNVPQVVVDASKPIALADLTGSFEMGETAASVAVASVGFDTNAGKLQLGGLSGSGRFAQYNATLQAGDVAGDVNAQAFDLSDLAVVLQGSEPVGTLTIPALALDLKQQTAQAAQIAFDGDAGRATVALNATAIVDAPQVDGSITAENFNVRRLLEQLELSPQFQDPDVLKSVSINATINGGLDAFSLEPLDVTLDETPIKGFVRVQQKPGASYSYDLNIGRINLDRYTPVADTASADPAPSTESSGNAAAAVVGPAEMLKNLTVDGTVRVESMTTGGMDINNVVLTTRSENGVVTMAPISAQLYDGQAQGSVVIDTNGEVPLITADQSLLNLSIGPALAGAGVSDKLSGTGNLVAKITASGVDAASISQSMKGTVAFDLADGAIKGFDLQSILVNARRAYEQYKDRDSMFEGELEEQTKFSAMSGTLVLDNGTASNDDLSIMAPLFRISGIGGASLVEQTIDYALSVNLVKSAEGQGGTELKDLENVTIPVKITGPFAEPAFRVDLVGLLKDKAKEEAKDKLREKLSEELGLPQTTGTDGEPQSTKDTLKGLLKQKVEQEAGIAAPQDATGADSGANSGADSGADSGAKSGAKSGDQAAEPERKRTKDILLDALTREVQQQTGTDSSQQPAPDQPSDDTAIEPELPAETVEAAPQEKRRLDDLLNEDTGTEADTGKRRRLDDLLETGDAEGAPTEANEQAAKTPPEPEQSSEDQLKDELKKKLLKSLFD